MDFLRSWIRNLILIILLAHFIEMLLPDNELRKYVKVVVGFFVMLAILTPVFKMSRREMPGIDFDWSSLEQVSFDQVVEQGEHLRESQQKRARKDYKEQMTNSPEIGTKIYWPSWKDLEPVEEEDNWTQKARKKIERGDIFVVPDYQYGVNLAVGNEDKEELTPAEKIDRAFLYHCKKRDNPYKGQNYYKKLTSSDEQNKSEDKTMLQELTNALKKHLPGDIKKQYKAGFRNGDLELTKKGVEVLVEEILADKYNDELTEKAEEIIKEHEEEE